MYTQAFFSMTVSMHKYSNWKLAFWEHFGFPIYEAYYIY